MDKLSAEFPCRSQQISLLSEFFLYPNFCTPDVIYVYGPHSTGKSTVVSRLFGLCDSVKVAHVNCIETYTNRLLFESILGQLYEDDTQRVCTGISMFINYLNMLHHHTQRLSDNKHIVIVLDRCEYLEVLGGAGEIFKSFASLRELSRIPSLSVVFISHLLPEHFSVDLTVALIVRFPQYTKDELLQILMLDKAESVSHQFYLNYLKSALSIFLRVTRDLSEMSYLVGSNFDKYCEPLQKGREHEDSMALWRNIAPHLRASLLSAYSGTSSLTEKTVGTSSEAADKSVDSSKSLVSLDLPYFSKYLLIAAYLASHNSAKYDKRLYLQNHGKRRKRKGDETRRSREAQATDLLGPRVFHLNRLLAIFYSIIEDKPNLTATLLSQVSNLVELRLLLQLSDSVLDRPNYKCMASYQVVDSVARTVEFNVSKYLMT